MQKIVFKKTTTIICSKDKVAAVSDVVGFYEVDVNCEQIWIEKNLFYVDVGYDLLVIPSDQIAYGICPGNLKGK